MKNFQYKSKVFFWSGLVMLMLAGTVWAFNGGIVKIKSVFAGEQSGTCSTPGCYSEEWKASEVFGLYRSAYVNAAQTTRDDGRLNDNGPFAYMTGRRVCGETGTVNTNIVSDYVVFQNGSSTACTYKANFTYTSGVNDYVVDAAYLDTSHVNYNPFVTGWTVNGHVH